MASSEAGLSLDDMLKISRQKKDHEKFAQSVFGKDRRSSAPGSLGKRRDPSIQSLASRVGVSKPAHRVQSNRDLKSKVKALAVRASPLAQQLDNGDIAVRTLSPGPAKPQNISIRGLAGPSVVMGSNFAPGTTAADIQSAMEPVGGEMQSCRIISARPTVIAEMVFTDRAGAEAVIETFNNQKADGRVLRIYLKPGPPSQPPAPQAPALQSHSPQPTSTQATAGTPLEQYDDVLESQESKSAEPHYEDGRYGFSSQQEEMEVEIDQQPDERAVHSDDHYQGHSDDRRSDRRDDRRENRRDERRDDRRGEDRRDGRRDDSRDNRGYHSAQNGSYRDNRGYGRGYHNGPRYGRGAYGGQGYSNRNTGRGYR